MAESSGRIKTVRSYEDFEKVLREAGDKLVVAEFFSDKVECVYSEVMRNKFYQLSERYHEAIFLKVDMDTCENAVGMYGIDATPTYLFFKEKEEIRRIEGARGERLEGAIMANFKTDTTKATELTLPAGQIDLSFLLDRERGCECLNDDDDHPYTNALHSGPEYLESDCDEQLIIALAFKHPVKLHSLQLTGPNDGRAPKSVKLFINQTHTLGFDDTQQIHPTQELCLTEDNTKEDTVIPLTFVKFQTVHSLTIFVKDNQGGEETTVINNIGLFGTPRDISLANLREPTPESESDDDDDLENILAYLIQLRRVALWLQGLIDMDLLEKKGQGSDDLSAIEKIAPKWLDLAQIIEMETETCEEITAQHPDDKPAACRAMFRGWLDGKAGLPPTWRILLEKLMEVDLEDVATQLEGMILEEAQQEEAATGHDETEAEAEADQDEAEVGENHPHSVDDEVINVPGFPDITARSEPVSMSCSSICAKTTFQVAGDIAQSFNWSGYGLQLHLPDNALPSDQTPCCIHVATSLPTAEQLDLPANAVPVSAFYDLTGPRQFLHPIMIKMEHCSHPSRYAALSFVVSRNENPCKFEYLEGGIFPADSSYGSVSVTHFTNFGIVAILKTYGWVADTLKMLFSQIEQPEESSSEPSTGPSTPLEQSGVPNPEHHIMLCALDPIRCYCAQIFYGLGKGMLEWLVHFTITCDLEVCKAVLTKEYKEMNAEPGPDLLVEFEGDMITLKTPKEDTTVQNGWSICPLSHPGIRKNQVDNFHCGRHIPSCQLEVMWTKKDEMPARKLRYKMEMDGAREPFNYFYISRDLPHFSLRRHNTSSSSGSISPSGSISSPTEKSEPCNCRTLHQENVYRQPELKDLVLLQVAEWYDLGLQLGVNDAELDIIQKNHPGDIKSCRRDMFRTWLKTANPSYLQLKKALNVIGEGNEVSRLCQILTD